LTFTARCCPRWEPPGRFFMSDANPILAEQTRGNFVENRHRGAFVIADAEGRIIVSAGDISRPIFPRSAIKSMQALAMVTSGSLGAFDLTDEELALACASHTGEDYHVEGVSHFLGHIGLSAADLECGAHEPLDVGARRAMRAAGERPTPVHNQCSGKHSGMLSVAQALGVPTRGYVSADHPVQQAVRQAIETVIGTTLTADRCGIDGCSIPTWAAPLSSFAAGFARMATGRGLPTDIANAARRIFDAATDHPELVSGTGQYDTVVMQAFGGRVMQKSGADGVQCGAIRDKGWGYAIKCDDGRNEASRVMVNELLLALADPDAGQRSVLDAFTRLPVNNANGIEVGQMQASDELRTALRG
jgi:L-asparaginase II